MLIQEDIYCEIDDAAVSHCNKFSAHVCQYYYSCEIFFFWMIVVYDADYFPSS